MEKSLQVIKFLRADSEWNKPIDYVIDFFNNHPLSPKNVEIEVDFEINHPDELTIFYQSTRPSFSENHYLIPAQNLLFSKTVYPSLMLSANSYQWQNQTLWSVERHASEHEQFVDNQQFGFDLIEAIFFYIGRYEEYHAPDFERDWNDELPSKKHFLVQNRLHHQPVVDHLVFCFWESLGFKMEQKMTTFRLSHDIDMLLKFPNFRQSIRSLGSAVKAKKNVGVFKKVAKAWYQTQKQIAPDPFDTFEWLLTEKPLEKVIYFMAGGRTKYDNFYQIDSLATQKIIEKALKRGYEIGLHPSYDAYLSEDLFLEEKEKLAQVVGQNIIKNRMHYLRFSFQKTPAIIDKAGILEDSTMGYQDLIGFRCGTGFPYRMFDFTTQEATTFLELPMVVMDCGLLSEVNYDVEKAGMLLKRFLQQSQFSTKITFNFHNSIFDSARLDEVALRTLYISLLEQLSSK